MDTIFAQATAIGKAGVSMIRVSGPDIAEVSKSLTGRDLPKHREAELRQIYHADGSLIDRALVLAFHGTESFTGEPVLEFHLHGSLAIVAAVTEQLQQLDALRYAEPGEFTKRALENGKLDLTQVEALSDLVEAETEEQRRQAMRGFDGAFSERIEIWRSKLIRAAGLLQVTLDFADEEVPDDTSAEVCRILADLHEEFERQLAQFQNAERLRTGYEVTILGPPNAGKSTLLNALAGREVAITSEIAGTTRDIVEVRLDLHGLPVTVLDTAGLRMAEDSIEQIGVDRALARSESADLRILLSEDGALPDLIQQRDADILRVTKADAGTNPELEISAHTGFGMDKLLEDIRDRLISKLPHDALATRERHRAVLAMAAERLVAAMDLLSASDAETELAAEEIRQALWGLRSLVGEIGVEDILDDIFRNFCLGK